MHNMFDSINTNLSGQNLVEASAGTGKTHSITNIFIRLLTEKEIPVQKILVVTFTDAATAELKSKIRTRIAEAIEYISDKNNPADYENRSGTNGSDRVRDELFEKLAMSGIEQTTALLKSALLNFDEAAIYTIHGFCSRMLSGNAFESGSRFDAELISDESTITNQIVEDFWRRYIAYEDERFLDYLLENNITIENFKEIVKKKLDHPELSLIPDMPDCSPESGSFRISERFFDEFYDNLNNLKAQWQKCRSDVMNIFGDTSVFSGSSFTAKIKGEMEQLMDNLTSASPDISLISSDRFLRFTTPVITEKAKTGAAVPEHPFFTLCDVIRNLDPFFRTYAALCRKLVGEFAELRNEIKRKRRIRSFADLITDFSDAIDSRTGNKLIESVREKYAAALIDEFQDTDPRQWNIFRKIFSGSTDLLFLIGDPKQSIYSFRGADVYSYFEASSAVSKDRQFTLLHNWRSEKGLISAVNTIFRSSPVPFRTDKITFSEAQYPADKQRRKYIEIETGQNLDQAPFHFWFIDKQNDKPVDRYTALDMAETAVADEIARLLALQRTGQLKYYEYTASDNTRRELSFTPGDIAVLVRTNRQGKSMHEALRSRNIPAVILDRQSVYESEDARMIETIMTAFTEPKNIRFLKAALATDLINKTAAEIDNLSNDDETLAGIIEKFTAYYTQWRQSGFFIMFSSFLQDNSSIINLLKLKDGERRVTNILHIAELLQKAASESSLNPEGLLKYLCSKIAGSYLEAGDSELRKESDERAVQIVTIHKSKGLEYPIVFCPYLWNVSAGKKTNPLFHTDTHGVVLDIGSEDIENNREKQRTEALEDELRLMYVALTRATCRCYMSWGYISKSMESAPFYLFHFREYSQKQNEVVSESNSGRKKELQKALSDITSYDMDNLREKLAADTECISFYNIPVGPPAIYLPEAGDNPLSRREFNGTIIPSDRVKSFSSLHTFRSDMIIPDNLRSSADRDGLTLDSLPAKGENKYSIFDLKGGSSTGSCLHEIFEKINFSGEGNDALTDSILRKYRIDENYFGCIREMIHNVLNVKLLPDNNDFSLSALSAADRLHEVEFYYPVRNKPAAWIREVLDSPHTISHSSGTDSEGLIARIPSVSDGYMNGFIDMIFRYNDKYYIVDWKSNKLGNTLKDYSRAGMEAAMKKEQYDLQYKIYMLALDLYLSGRIENYDFATHFGGVIYIFLRGVTLSNNSGTGIYFEQPDKDYLYYIKSRLFRPTLMNKSVKADIVSGGIAVPGKEELFTDSQS